MTKRQDTSFHTRPDNYRGETEEQRLLRHRKDCDGFRNAFPLKRSSPRVSAAAMVERFPSDSRPLKIRKARITLPKVHFGKGD